MIDLALLEKRGISVDGLKEKFVHAHKSYSKQGKAIAHRPEDKRELPAYLAHLMTQRVIAARDFNAEHYQLFYALDLAYDAGFQQINPTLLSNLLDKSPDNETVLNALKGWGMDPAEVFSEVPDPKNPSKNIVKPSAPAFFKIIVPLVSSYVKIRWAKIMNERRLVPFMKFEPAVNNELSRLRCEVITSRGEVMARSYGFYDVEKQAVFQMLHYGEAMAFPMEQWHQECQEMEDNPHFKGEKIEGKKTIKVVTKEGMRYHLPHITRRYYDRAYFPSTINTDTGCQFYGYWRTNRWGELARNKDFYNLDIVGFKDSVDWTNRHKAYWVNTSGCSMKFPGNEIGNSGVSKLDSENHLANNFYNNTHEDTAVIVTEHFEKLVPSEWGLGDYDYPVWFRFVLAGDGVVIYAAPLPYAPGRFYGYDMAEGRTRIQSMSLEVLPFQDQFSNLLTQYLYTVRQNLNNAVFVDTNMVDENWIGKIANWGEKFWRGINFIPFDGQKLKRGNNNIDRAFVPHKFPYQDTQGLVSSMKVILDTLERVLVMSAQEVGQAATHEQTAEEVRNVASNTETRVIFTTTPVDVARDAWKKQIYQALMAFGEDEFYVQVPMDDPIDAEELKALGFSYADDKEKSYDIKSRKAKLKVTKAAIAYESFASERDGNDRINNAQVAGQMIEFLQVFTANPQTYAAVGPEQIIMIANNIARLAGYPRDFQLKATGAMPEADFQNQIMQALEQTKEQIFGEVQEAVGELATANKNQDTALQDTAQGLAALQQQLAQLQQIQANPIPFDPTQAPMAGVQ